MVATLKILLRVREIPFQSLDLLVMMTSFAKFALSEAFLSLSCEGLFAHKPYLAAVKVF